jgi:hypothetical protein
VLVDVCYYVVKGARAVWCLSRVYVFKVCFRFIRTHLRVRISDVLKTYMTKNCRSLVGRGGSGN